MPGLWLQRGGTFSSFTLRPYHCRALVLRQIWKLPGAMQCTEA